MERMEKTAEEILKSLSLEDKAKLLSQVVWETTDIHQMHEKLEKFLLADGPGGIRRLKEYFDEDIYNTKPSTCYPSPSTYASSWNRELLYQLGEHMGKEARQEEVDTMLAPAVNIKRSPLGGRNFEYYSEDPYLTGELAGEFIKGIQKEGIGACLKHFAANNQETRRMNINAVIAEETLHEIYLSAFEKPVKEGKPRMVMMGYNQINGEYCASNAGLLQLLREDWGYGGVVVTDCYAAHDLGQGISKGLTLQMPGESGERITARIKGLIEKGMLTEEQLNDAVLKNIRFALEANASREQGYTYDRQAHHDFARKLAEESMVLLKNEGGVLPLDKSERILVVGELAEKPRFQGGGSSHVNPWKLEIPLEEMKKLGTELRFAKGYTLEGNELENQSLLKETLAEAAEFDKIVVFAGIPDLIESEGYDRASIELPQGQNDLIEALTEIGKPLIVVLSNGSVVEMPWREKVSGILECYLGGEAGASACARILFGEVNPSGRLAETFPVRLEDTPSYLYFPGSSETVVYAEGQFVGYKYYDAKKISTAFPFGHGLSYTEFAYERPDSGTGEQGRELVDEKRGRVFVRVKNTGARAGYETIQVYVQKKEQGKSPCPKKLVGFSKIYLQPGEQQELEICLSEKTFQQYTAREHCWKKTNGIYEFFIGSSVENIRLQEIVEIGDVPYVMTEDSNIGDMIRIPGMYEKLEKLLADHPVSLNFLTMTKDEDPLKAISMGSLMTLRTLKRTDATLLDKDIEMIISEINKGMEGK